MTVRNRFLLLAIGIAFVLDSQGSFAKDEPRHPCAQVHGDTERLACYDKAFGKPAEAAATTEQFGFTGAQLERDSGAPEKPEGPASVTAKVQAVEMRRDGKFVATLDNAQVWSQSELNSKADVQVGDAVTVRRGLLGSYLLVTKAGIATRVKRVK